MSVPWLYLMWVIGIKLVGGFHPKVVQPSFTLLSKREFCKGHRHVSVNPSCIPQLLDYLKYCTTLSKQPNVDSYAKRQALIHLFDSATPVVHKAFFDSKTALKYVVLFTKLKHDAVQYATYANKYGDRSIYSRKKVSAMEGTLQYAPENDDGSYNLNDDLYVCASILNRQQNTSVKNIIKASQLPRVAKAARMITFPPFNLSLAVSSEDTPLMILDMYVLAMRCLSFTDLHPNTTAQVSEYMIYTLKRKVMPFVPPHEFEKAYLGMMSVSHSGTVGNTEGEAMTSAPSIVEQPVDLKLQDTRDGNSVGSPNGPRADSNTSNFSKLKQLMGVLKGKVKNAEQAWVIGKTCHGETHNDKGLTLISAILGACVALGVVLYCLLFGCCGWLAVSKDISQDHDEVDERLEGYARLSPGNPRQCYCTLEDSNQMDVIAALHLRCELLSKKICEVVREISKENVYDDPESMDDLRRFVRSVSTNMVEENETIYHFGKSVSSYIIPHNKGLSVKQSAF